MNMNKVERMKKKYSTEEIAEANAPRD